MTGLKSFFSRPFGSAVAGGAVVAITGILAINVGLIDANENIRPDEVAPTIDEAIPLSEPVSDGNALTAGQIYEKSGPAVAFIEAEQTQTSGVFGVPPQNGSATGSGFLVDDAGHILTNAHVVDGSDSITVRFGEDGKRLDATLLGSDTSTDVAVIAVDPDQVTATPLELADSDEISVGDPVVAIGNPFGLERTVTTGIISALQREISAPDNFTISDVIQTDASINPGNSGGPLLDSQGRVIGINSQIATDGTSGGSVGVGFAVPVNTARQVGDQLIETGDVEHAYLGIQGGDLSPELADLLNLEIESGALIQAITPDGPADQAGLRGGEATVTASGQEIRVGGDVITEINGESVNGMDDVISTVNRAEPGDKVELEIHRDGETRTVTVDLEDRPSEEG